MPPPLSAKAAARASAKKPAKVATVKGARMTGRAAPGPVKSAAVAEAKQAVGKDREGELKVPEAEPVRAGRMAKIGEISSSLLG